MSLVPTSSMNSIYEDFCLRAELELSLNKTQLAHCHQLFSDILDAMLEALKAKGKKFVFHDWLEPVSAYALGIKDADNWPAIGWLIFIPEEEEA